MSAVSLNEASQSHPRPKSWYSSTKKNFDHFKETGTNVCLLNLSEGEILMNYGGRFGAPKPTDPSKK